MKDNIIILYPLVLDTLIAMETKKLLDLIEKKKEKGLLYGLSEIEKKVELTIVK